MVRAPLVHVLDGKTIMRGQTWSQDLPEKKKAIQAGAQLDCDTKAVMVLRCLMEELAAFPHLMACPTSPHMASQAWWCPSVIQALGKLRQEAQELVPCLGFIETLFVK